MGINSNTGRRDSGAAAFAPWTWSTDDADLATALEALFRELCCVPVCSEKEKEMIGEMWSELVGDVMKMFGRDARSIRSQSSLQLGDGSKCHNFRKENYDSSLKTCDECRMAWYCSKDCQKAHWMKHK
ncbi:hypothetical protein BU23DRAFT_560319 [Bimuria novae-zelandiae CBS 107.79]|uniref:MYND-type domain-containing protein n=1 Tax=Bimuria novae-zelandiae CBS 107.79 TaxID=1447943 RepID=A0A6A5UNQ5_9PLEO|nr:hypothetical protein BU23DRAFT_560319 [Bimuria novae-zelandiae CBS 107.79]